MECKYERTIRKFERWINKEIRRVKLNDASAPETSQFHSANGGQIKAYYNMLSILNQEMVKAAKMKV